MERDLVNSSSICSVGYDCSTDTLEVEFVNGSIYQYYGVQNNIYENFLVASSKGQFFNTYVRSAYPYSRIG